MYLMSRPLLCTEEVNPMCPCLLQAGGCSTVLSAQEVEEGEVDQMVKRLVALINEV